MNSFIFPPNKIRHIQKVDNKWPNHWFVDDCFYGYLPHFIAVCHGTLDVEPAVCKLILSVYSTVPVLTQPVASVWWLFPKLYWITRSPYVTLAKLTFFLPPSPPLFFPLFFFFSLFFFFFLFLFFSTWLARSLVCPPCCGVSERFDCILNGAWSEGTFVEVMLNVLGCRLTY